MSTEEIRAAAVARLGAAGLPEALAQRLAGRSAGGLEQLRRQVEAIPPEIEPATMFTAALPGKKRHA
jgi:hypothetical protein